MREPELCTFVGLQTAVEVTQHAINHLAPAGGMGVYDKEVVDPKQLIEYIGQYMCRCIYTLHGFCRVDSILTTT